MDNTRVVVSTELGIFTLVHVQRYERIITKINVKYNKWKHACLVKPKITYSPKSPWEIRRNYKYNLWFCILY